MLMDILISKIFYLSHFHTIVNNNHEDKPQIRVFSYITYITE